MGKDDKEYDAFEIFEQIQEQEGTGAGQPLPRPLSPEPVRPVRPVSPVKPVRPVLREEAPYYEIEYDSCPMPGVGKFVLKMGEGHSPDKSSTIKVPQQQEQERDAVRERFNQMRDIARESRCLTFSNSKFYDKRVQQENSRLFYRQGMFMKEFEDDCGKSLPYSAYFPNYQMMGYGQLRTYFTWRTRVRQGDVQATSLSYAFLYLYELVNNIGVEGPEDGLERLMIFWEAYRVYDASIDKYVLRWLKDYHIYYELPWSFKEFIDRNGLGAHFPKLTNPEDDFGLYCAISKYDIRKSGFYTEERMPLLKDCFHFIMDRLSRAFAESHVDLEEYIFRPTRNMSVWTPFQGALFYPALRQRDRRVVLSEKEIYLCSGNRWTFSTVITTESGRQLIGFCLKQMESVLRRLTKYRHKLSANINSLSPVMVQELGKDGISLEEVVTGATEEFYREATKTVVKVDNASLEKIRQEALATQERLIVPEEPLQTAVLSGKADSGRSSRDDGEISGREQPAEMGQLSGADNSQARERESLYGAMPGEKNELSGNGGEISETAQESSGNSGSASPWDSLKEALSETERKALRLVAEGETNLKPFADGQGVMLEVLMDGINEKAMDSIGDSILDDGFELYDDYREQVKEMVESL
nr:TerB N-terminal domain-containing protein [uncultured Acetatifactor sp.]